MMEGIGILPLLLRLYLLSLCFYATVSSQNLSANLHGMSTLAAHNAIHYIAMAIAR